MSSLKNIFKKQGGFRLLKQYWQGGALFTAIIQFIILGRSKTALEILRLSANLKIKRKLQKKYMHVVKNFKHENVFPSKPEKRDIIWFCWFQGIENAPQLVRKCYESICANLEGKQVVLITEKNYKEFLYFPDYIQEKIDKKIIFGAHMSDLIRLELLSRHGGTWIDATVLCTGSDIPKYMLESELFVFQNLKPGVNGNSKTISNWFITSCSHHPIIELTKELLYSYWKKNDAIVDYFIFHYFFQMAIETYPELWNRVIPFSNSTPHIILLRLFEKYDENLWNSVKAMVPFHKLSYKFSEEEKRLLGTYYDIIINEE